MITNDPIIDIFLVQYFLSIGPGYFIELFLTIKSCIKQTCSIIARFSTDVLSTVRTWAIIYPVPPSCLVNKLLIIIVIRIHLSTADKSYYETI